MLAALFLLRAAVAACASGRSPDAQRLAEAVARAEGAYVAVDGSAFYDATDAVGAEVACLGVPVPRYLAGPVHRWMALRAFGDRSDALDLAVDPALARAGAAFAAARTLEPVWVPPDGLLPPPARTLFDAASGRAATEEVWAPASGELWFDGEPTRLRPVDRATLVQWEDGAGVVQASAYVWPGDPLPDYPAVPPVEPTPTVVRSSPRRGLLVAAVAGLATAGATYGTAGYVRWRYEQAALADKADLRSVTNALVVTSGAIGGVALAVGVAGVVVGP